MKFVTIGYGDQAGYDRTGPATRDAAHAHDEHLRQVGVQMGAAGQPVQVRNHDAAGMVVDPEVLAALEEAAAQEKGRQKPDKPPR